MSHRTYSTTADGSEHFYGEQRGKVVLFTAAQVNSILASPLAPVRQAGDAVPLSASNADEVWGLQHGKTVVFTAAALAQSLSLAGSVTPGTRGLRGAAVVTSVTGDETIYGMQGGKVLEFGAAQTSLIAGGGVPTVPAAPSVAVTSGDTQNSVAWTDGSNGGASITAHKVYGSTTSGFTPGGGNLLYSGAAASPYAHTGLTNGTTWYYKVVATNSVGDSAASTQQAGTPSAAATAPAAPTLAVTAGNAQNSITWTDGSNGGSAITARKLYRSTTSGFTPGPGNLIATSPTFPYADTGLTNGTTYYYKGIATNVIGDSLASTQQSGTPVASSATFTMPDNWDFMYYGDSRSTLGGGNPGATIGSGTYIVSQTTGGLDFWLPLTTQQRLRPNAAAWSYGIGGQAVGPQGTSNMLAIPRPTTPTLGLDYIAAQPASLIVFYGGVNNGTNADSTQTKDAILDAFKALTDPTFVYPPSGAVLPLAGGRPKNIIVLNETTGGITKTGGGPSNYYLTQPVIDALGNLSAYYNKFDYASGDALANPRIKVIDTWSDPTIWDTASGTLRRNIQGVHVDDVHPMPYGMYRIAARIAAWANAVTGTGAPVVRSTLPTTATAATFCNANPLSTGTTGTTTGTGTVSGVGVPTGWAILLPAGLNVDVATALDVGGSGRNVVTLRVTGTNATDGASLRVRQTSFNNRTIGSAGDIYRGVAKLSWTLTSGVLQQTLMSLDSTWANANYRQQITTGAKPSLYGGQTRYLNEQKNIDQVGIILQTPPLDLSAYSGQTFTSNNFDLNFQFSTGVIDHTFVIEGLSFAKTGS